MVRHAIRAVCTILLVIAAVPAQSRVSKENFVSIRDGRMYLKSRPYYFIGTNYWYGSLLPLERDRKRGIDRLRAELDFLKTYGVTNLRLMAGAEGSGPMNGVERVRPPLQPVQGKFDERVARGLDVVLAEMAKRDMKAVIFFSNNWEWSGGVQQYLIWNNQLSSEWLTTKPDWDQLRDNVAKFYSCEPCINAYRKQVEFLVLRRNKINGRRYIDDATIMAWELANEPRPMRPAAAEAYLKWIKESAALIRSLDRRHLITTGHEGWIGTEGIPLFERAHSDLNIDYITIHIWPKNWGWLETGSFQDALDPAYEKTMSYIRHNSAVASRLGKPMVIEEFGLPRDGNSVDPSSTTRRREVMYWAVLDEVGKTNVVGANFWAYGGSPSRLTGRPQWKPGDPPTGDPPMEEQGLNSVFDNDVEIWRTINYMAHRLRP